MVLGRGLLLGVDFQADRTCSLDQPSTGPFFQWCELAALGFCSLEKLALEPEVSSVRQGEYAPGEMEPIERLLVGDG